MDILIIEDEKPSAVRLVNLLKECCADANVLAVLQSVKEGVEYFGSGKSAELIISDVSLPDGLCFSIFEGADISCPVIFTTAYDEYALRAFEYNSIAYLLKPIRKEMLEKAISKLSSNMSYSDISALLKSLVKGQVKWRERILVEDGDECLPVMVDNISFIQSDLGATKVVKKDNSSHLCNISLDRLEEQLNPDCFLRVSRQYIVNIENVESIKRVDTKHSLIRMKDSNEQIATTNSRCNRLKLLLDR